MVEKELIESAQAVLRSEGQTPLAQACAGLLESLDTAGGRAVTDSVGLSRPTPTVTLVTDKPDEGLSYSEARADPE